MYKMRKNLALAVLAIMIFSISMAVPVFAEAEVLSKIIKVGESFEVGIDGMWTSENPDIVQINRTPCPAFPGSTHDYAVAVAVGTAVLKYTSGSKIMEVLVIPEDAPTFKISGFIAPDFDYTEEAAMNVRSSFMAELSKTDITAYVDADGYFELKDIPAKTDGYTLKISKDGYLERTVKINWLDRDLQLSTMESPIKMLAGDIPQKGVQDKAINMSDIMEVAKSFNLVVGDVLYNLYCDLNVDHAINMQDIMIVAKSFNKIPADYQPLEYPDPVVLSTPIPTESPTPTPLSEQWIPANVAMDSLDLSLEKDSAGNYKAVLGVTFPNSGYRVVYNPDQVAMSAGINGQDIYIIKVGEAKVEAFTGASLQVLTRKTFEYNLGNLSFDERHHNTFLLKINGISRSYELLPSMVRNTNTAEPTPTNTPTVQLN